MVVYTDMRTIQTLGKVNQRILKNAFGFKTIRDAKKSFDVDTNTDAYELMRELYNLAIMDIRTNEKITKPKKSKTIIDKKTIDKNVVEITQEDNIHTKLKTLFSGSNIAIVLKDGDKIIKTVYHNLPANSNEFNHWWKKTGFYIFYDGTGENDGFFNNYEDGKAYVFKSDTNIKPKHIKQFFKEGKTNCLLTPIKNWAIEKSVEVKSKKSKERYTTILNKINAFMDTYHNTGVSEDIISIISSKLQVAISITKPLCDINYIEAKPPKKALKHFKYINSKCGHIDLDEIVDESDYEIVSRDKLHEISEELKNTNQFFSFKPDIIGYKKIITINGGYKLKNDFQDFIIEFEKNTGLNNCKIDDVKDAELSRFIKYGTHYNGTVDFRDVKKVNTKKVKHIDMEKAYTKYKLCKYYSGFLGKITDFRKTNKIVGVGLYQIKNLSIPSGKFKTLNDKLRIYKNYNVYTSTELNMLTDNGATFIIICGCWGITPLHFDLTDEEFLEKYDKVSGYAKYIGMCDIHSLENKMYMRGDRDMFSILEEHTTGKLQFYPTEYDRHDVNNIDYKNGMGDICVSYPKKSNFHLGHITSFITAYQRLNALEQLLNMDYDNLIRICVDGIYYNGDTPKLYNAFRDKSDKINFNNDACDTYISNVYKHLSFVCGEERDFYKNEIHIGQGGNGKTHYNLMDTGLIRPLYVAPSWKLSTKKSREYDIRNNVNANIDTKDPEKINFIKQYHNTIIIDEVSMMCEKSKQFILNTYSDMKLIFCGDVCYQAPQFQEDEEEIELTGFEKIIEHYENYRFKCEKLITLTKQMRELIKKQKERDETEILYELSDIILPEHYNSKIGLRNLIWACRSIDNMELALHISSKSKVFGADEETRTDFVDNLFMIYDEKHKKPITIRTLYHIAKISNLEKYDKIIGYTKQINKIVLDTCSIINRDTLKEMYKIDDMILTRSHKTKDLYTQMFPTMEKWYVNENTRTYKNGEIIIGDKPDVSCELQHAFTVHSIQGETAKHKLFIDMSNQYDGRILYTAISRATTLDQIYLVL